MNNYHLEKAITSSCKDTFSEKVFNSLYEKVLFLKKYLTFSHREFPTQLLLPETCEVSVGMNHTIKTWSF